MSGIVIQQCPPEFHREALEMVLEKVPAAQRASIIEALRPIAKEGVDVFSALAIAIDKGKLVGSVWIQPQIGRTATFWPTVMVADASEEVRFELSQYAMQLVSELPVSLVQALVDDDNDPFVAVLDTLDFAHLADLIYLMRTVPIRCEPPNTQSLELVPEPDSPELLRSLTVQTYQETKDCPGLEGLRKIEDTLSGYRTIGEYDPALWNIVRWNGEPAGVLLVSPYPDSKQWELVYIGIVAGARGHGLGKQVLRELEYRASRAEVEHIVLAVDAANRPALAMYEESGYIEWNRRVAYISTGLSET